jgi:hypothetical protein
MASRTEVSGESGVRLGARQASDPREVVSIEGEPRKFKDDPVQKPAPGRFRNTLAEILRVNRIRTGVSADYQEQFRRLLAIWIPRSPI